MQKTKLLIFDIDGTLVDSTTAYHKVVIKAMQEMGFVTIDTNFNALKHHTDSYALLFNYEKNFNQRFSEALLDDFEELLVKYLKKQSPTVEIKGAKQSIEELKKSEYAIVFATGSLPKAALLKMKEAGIWIDPEVLATSKTSFTREGFVLEAIGKAKSYYNVTDFEKIIAVGDGVWDLKTAQNLDIDFIGIGAKNKELMEQEGMQHWFKDFTNFDLSKV
ncbi:HAD family hydrolase [Pseudofulvibacter geojedonensis]|uniref:phosphoglycolate phosphatase n=1 Tax=Pseudofulvibacter geojedonensis TaxID=1123758 RepID=A0ABW3I038_9FLAO